MKNNLAKSIATAFIWLIASLVSLAAILSVESSQVSSITGLLGIALFAATASTFFMWVAPELAHNDRLKSEAERGAEQEKHKHYSMESTRIAALLEMMDEDEREVFKAQLKRKLLGESRLSVDNDGELNANIGQLLQTDDDPYYERHSN